MTPRPSYVSGPSSRPLLGETIGENLRRTVERVPDRDALVVRGQNIRFTWRQLWDESGRAARGLMALGVQVGDRVGIWSPNRYEWVVLQFAAARAGAILVSLNPAYRTSELAYALAQSGATVLVMARGFKGADYPAMVKEVRDRCPALVHALVLEDDWESLCDRRAGASDAALSAREAQLQFDDPINIQYTSGTTGMPKGATLSHHNILNNGYFVGELLGYTEADRVGIPVPFYHCFGMVIGNLACASHGACMVVPGEAFDPGAVLAAIAEERCTSLYGVPTMFIGLLDHPGFDGFDRSSLRTGIMAGSPCPIEVMKKVLERLHMPEVCIAYGMTETSPCSTQTASDDPLAQRVGSVGRVHPHVEIKIVAPATGAVVPRGERGELCTRGYSVMLGYWNDDAATARAIDAAGWMHTGDLATLDENGYVNIVGRLKDMIIRGGENISPREIEELLYTHPAVADVQVIGVPSEKWGEEVMAWVKPRPGETLTPEALTAFCKAAIAGFKVPRYWKLCDAFPMTVTGKVQKFRMRELAIAELGLEAAARIVTA
ncbi:MAG TPA: AMP-binding protein [Kofleriaceae bacterium]|nr:AMP-binding protein [Kofleriaceae bacterium]